MGKINDISSATAGDKAAAKRVMYVVAPVIIIGMVVWTIGAVYFMNMIFTKIGFSRGIIAQTTTGGSTSSVDTPIIAEDAVRMVCEGGKYRYDFYLDNNYEVAYPGQPFNLESGTYTISGKTIILTNSEGVIVHADYSDRILFIEPDSFKCTEHDGE